MDHRNDSVKNKIKNAIAKLLRCVARPARMLYNFVCKLLGLSSQKVGSFGGDVDIEDKTTENTPTNLPDDDHLSLASSSQSEDVDIFYDAAEYCEQSGAITLAEHLQSITDAVTLSQDDYYYLIPDTYSLATRYSNLQPDAPTFVTHARNRIHMALNTIAYNKEILKNTLVPTIPLEQAIAEEKKSTEGPCAPAGPSTSILSTERQDRRYSHQPDTAHSATHNATCLHKYNKLIAQYEYVPIWADSNITESINRLHKYYNLEMHRNTMMAELYSYVLDRHYNDKRPELMGRLACFFEGLEEYAQGEIWNAITDMHRYYHAPHHLANKDQQKFVLAVRQARGEVFHAQLKECGFDEKRIFMPYQPTLPTKDSQYSYIPNLATVITSGLIPAVLPGENFYLVDPTWAKRPMPSDSYAACGFAMLPLRTGMIAGFPAISATQERISEAAEQKYRDIDMKIHPDLGPDLKSHRPHVYSNSITRNHCNTLLTFDGACADIPSLIKEHAIALSHRNFNPCDLKSWSSDGSPGIHNMAIVLCDTDSINGPVLRARHATDTKTGTHEARQPFSANHIRAAAAYLSQLKISFDDAQQRWLWLIDPSNQLTYKIKAELIYLAVQETDAHTIELLQDITSVIVDFVNQEISRLKSLSTKRQEPMPSASAALATPDDRYKTLSENYAICDASDMPDSFLLDEPAQLLSDLTISDGPAAILSISVSSGVYVSKCHAESLTTTGLRQ